MVQQETSAGQLRGYIAERATTQITPVAEKASAIENKVPPFARGAVHGLFDRLDVYRPPDGFDQETIPTGFFPENPTHKFVTRSILRIFEHPHIVETREGRDIAGEAREWRAQGGDILVMGNHLSHFDGPELVDTLEGQGIDNVTSVLGIRIIRNPVARRVMHGVPIIPVYPESEQFWKSDAFREIRDGLTDDEKAFVQRERSLGFRMNRDANEAMKGEFARGHAVLLLPEGSRSRDGGLQEPVPSAACVVNKADRVKILVMTLMGTEKTLPVGAGVPRFAKVRVRFVDLLEPKAIEAEYRRSHPDARKSEIEGHILAEVMKTMAEGLEPSYRGVYKDAVDSEAQFVPIESVRSPQNLLQKQTVFRHSTPGNS